MSHTSDSLSSTLTLALIQCQEQVRIIEQQAARIELLQKENGRLRDELHKTTQSTTSSADLSQVEDLFQKNAEARAEIQALKTKLKQYKEKANRRLSAPFSSPLPTPLPSSTKRVELASGDTSSSSPTRKRARIKGQHALHVGLTNASSTRVAVNDIPTHGHVDMRHAIQGLTEDGEEHEPNVEEKPQEVARGISTHKSLESLLKAPDAGKSLLARPTSVSTAEETACTIKHAAVSNITHTTSNTPRALTPPIGDIRKPLPARISRTMLETDSPLRTKSPTKLHLFHFKPNPRWLDSHGVSYDDFLRGSYANRAEALVSTLPQLQGQHERCQTLTDDELLRGLLGPDSEVRIASLTSVARANLVLEAKRKRVAQAFAKGSIEDDITQEPPGFWSTDMPSTQEEEENRRAAFKKEREEVKRRYDDAMKGQGRWLFADECH